MHSSYSRHHGNSISNPSFYESLRNPRTHFQQPSVVGVSNERRPVDLPHADEHVGFGQEDAEHVNDTNASTHNRQTRSHDYEENSVPESLLMEAQDVASVKVGQSPQIRAKKKHGKRNRMADFLLPLPSTTPDDLSQNSRYKGPSTLGSRLVSSGQNPKERALWKWVNVTNLDVFIKEVYDYFDGNGVWCILFDRALHIIETAFIAMFLTFLTQCVSYHRIPKSNSLTEVVVPQCTQKMSGLWNFGIWIYAIYFIWKCVQMIVDAKRLFEIRDFYINLLNIPEQDMQTISWQDVVARIMALRDSNPTTAVNMLPGPAQFLGPESKQKLDAHDIANRLMRQDNYFIAMINKDIINVTFNVPLLGQTAMLSKNLQWYLYYCIIDLVFDSRGQVHSEFLRADQRAVLSTKLRQRFHFAAVVSFLFSPFVLAWAVIVYFFTYYNEYQRDPSKVGARRYTPLAEWKLREFNELPHIFEDRLKMSYPFASRYLDQFPKRLSDRVFRTISFISGSLLAVLAIASLLDEKMFLGFEITPDRTVLFYIGILGVIWKGSRDSIQEETLVFDPEYAMNNVIEYTRYMPDSWVNRLHSFDVKKEFSEMYKMKLIIFLEELVGIVTTPYVLWNSVPDCSESIIDFFREFTIHVEGLGYVCSFAVFDFKKGVDRGNSNRDSTTDVKQGYYTTKHGKMAASYYGFLDNYVINPKTGIPGHLPPVFRSYSDETRTSDPDPLLSRDFSDRAKGSSGPTHPVKTTRFAQDPQPQPSPLASALLDPHHQPSVNFLSGPRSLATPKLRSQSNRKTIRIRSPEALTGKNHQTNNRNIDDEYDGQLGESMWQTSGGKTLHRDKSSINDAKSGAEDPGVLGLIYQLQQAHRNRPGGTGTVI